MPIQTYQPAPAKTTTPAATFQSRPWSLPAPAWPAPPQLDPATPRPRSAPAGFSFGQISVSRPAPAMPDNAPGLRLSGHKIPVASPPTLKLILNRPGLPHGVQPGLVVQPKLTIGAPNDKYEREADRVAAQVVQQLHAPASPAIQTQATPEAEKLQMQPQLQLKASQGSLAAPPALESSIRQLRGHGQPLAESIRQPMEQAFGADFSRVRVHTDAQADQLNQSIQAKAFTTGQDVFFRQGAYEPGNRGGHALIAHELTHVVQQNGSNILLQRILSAPGGVVQRKDDYYAWGTADTTPHLHVHSAEMHLKIADRNGIVHRYNIVKNNKLHVQHSAALTAVQGKHFKKLRQTIKRVAKEKFGFSL